MKVRILYDLRQAAEFCSGNDLAEFFRAELGDPSPSGKRLIDNEKARKFISECVRTMLHNSEIAAQSSIAAIGYFSEKEGVPMETFLWRKL